MVSIALPTNSFAARAKAFPHVTAKLKIALSLSYTGNDWQSEAENLVKAEAATPPYNKLVDLRIDVAGSEVTQQIATINNEVGAGEQAIITYPLSPTALNSTVEQACAHHVLVFSFDGLITAPCAYNVHPNLVDLGYKAGLWLGQQLHGHGNIALIHGIVGTADDEEEVEGVQMALAKYPGVKITANATGNWDQALIKTAFASLLVSHPNIDGVWGITGCSPVYQVLKAQGHALIPCAGGGTEAERMLMLPKSEGGQGSNNVSIGAPPYDGELAFIQAVQVLQGKHIPQDTIMPTVDLNPTTVKLGTNPASGANVYPETKVTPGFYDDFWSALVEQGLTAALTGKPDKVSTQKSCSQVPGCKQQAHLVINKTYPGGN
jgi:ribose transport system substrate-binding protein